MDESDEAPSASEALDQKVLETIARFPSGCPDDELRKQFSSHAVSEYVEAVNSLLADQKVEVLRLGSQIYYQAKSAPGAEDGDALSLYETVIYRLIEEGGTHGVWVRDLKAKSNVPHPKLPKVLRSLQRRKLVKSLNVVGAPRQKVYILYDLEPDDSISGGALYTEQQLDIQYVDLISRQCLRFLKQKAEDQSVRDESKLAIDWEYVGSAELCEFVNELKISKSKVHSKEIEKVMDTLVYESVVERTHSGEMKMYRVARPIFTPGGFSQSPCFFCPVFYDCTSGGLISPGGCRYFDQILD